LGFFAAFRTRHVIAIFEQLSGVTAVATDDVWAVGMAPTSGVNNAVTEHWDGSAWSTVPAPNGSTAPDGKAASQLVSVAAVSSNNVWAVGWTSTTVGGFQSFQGTLIENWDGLQWTQIPSPNGDGSSQNALTGIAVIAANDIWAVGYTDNQTLTEHWDGFQWSIVPSPNVGYGPQLSGVTALASNDVWAVGSSNNYTTTLVLHWDGSSWNAVSSPNSGEYGHASSLALYRIRCTQETL
jgi:predicted SnoaL-like aldol condensation-catalyzing enzyme